MKRVAVITLVFALSVASTVLAGDGTNYGDGVTIDAAVPVETLLSSPDDYIGKAVRVDGVITGVCKKRGCWMQITDPDTGNGSDQGRRRCDRLPVHRDGEESLGRGSL